MLGGSHFQVPAIIYAKKAGYHVITADNIPENPGHKYSDEYYKVSTVEKDEILKLSEKLKIDGIVSYASDPGSPTAAYTAEKLGLPGNPYDSVMILQRKDLFREFLMVNNYPAPSYESFKSLSPAKEYAFARLKDSILVVKPADSSGSKGVTKIENIIDFEAAYNNAMLFSMSKNIVVEDFINKSIYEMDGDGFVLNGTLVFRCFGNQHNDIECNPYVPMGISFPYIQEKKMQDKAHDMIEKLLRKLDMKIGGLNIEYLTDTNGSIYILEIGPRSGGNLIPEVIRYSTGVDLIEYTVESTMGKDCSNLRMQEPNGFYSSYILHSKSKGRVKDVIIDKKVSSKILRETILVNKGDYVEKFNGSNNTLGTFILKFDNIEEMLYLMDRMDKLIYVKLD